jgi:hypothetical protein
MTSLTGELCGREEAGKIRLAPFAISVTRDDTRNFIQCEDLSSPGNSKCRSGTLIQYALVGRNVRFGSKADIRISRLRNPGSIMFNQCICYLSIS